MKKWHFGMLLLPLVLCACGRAPDADDRISRDREQKLEPVIRFVEGFVKKNGRLPTDEEFHATADKLAWMVVLRDRSNAYAAEKGAKNNLDYMVGIWRADWYHYYKSWDRQFFNADDEKF